MSNTQQMPAGAYPSRTKYSQMPYENYVIPGSIASGGTLSTLYDISDWTLTAIEIPGTLSAGTINFWASLTRDGTYRPVTDTAGNALAVIGTQGNQVITDIPELAPLRYIKLVTGGTQSSAQTLNLIVK